jgi:transposase-like protein
MWIVRQYSDEFRSRMVERMVGPGAVSANALALEVGVSQNSLSRWLREARSLRGMSETSKGSNRPKKKWSGAEKLRIVMEASALTGSELGALLRREGVHEAELREWRAAAEAALQEASRGKARPSNELKRIKELERELERKEKALAETAALLVLKKKVQAIWGDEDDTTSGRSGR